MVVDYYRRPMLRQVLIYVIAVVALYLLSVIPQTTLLSVMLQNISTFVMSLLLCFGPLVFADENSRQLTVLLPARASEKFTVILLWCFVAVPFIIWATWTVMWCATLWTDVAVSFGELYGVMDNHTLEILYPWLCAIRVVQDSITVLIVLWVALAARRGVTSKAVLAAFGTMVGFGIIGMIIGFVSVWVIMPRLQGQSLLEQADVETVGELFTAINTYTDGLFYTVLMSLTALVIIVEVLLFWRCYRIVAHRQV